VTGSVGVTVDTAVWGETVTINQFAISNATLAAAPSRRCWYSRLLMLASENGSGAQEYTHVSPAR
jgi:hypothetical protein